MISGNTSISDTCTPTFEKKEANSHPIAPPPITTKWLGNLATSRISLLVTTCASSKPGITGNTGDAPVAIITFSAWY